MGESCGVYTKQLRRKVELKKKKIVVILLNSVSWIINIPETSKKDFILPPQHSHFHCLQTVLHQLCSATLRENVLQCFVQRKPLFILDFEETHFLINQYIFCNLKIVQRTSILPLVLRQK